MSLTATQIAVLVSAIEAAITGLIALVTAGYKIIGTADPASVDVPALKARLDASVATLPDWDIVYTDAQPVVDGQPAPEAQA